MGVGEAAAGLLELHRRHAEIEIDEIGHQPLGGQLVKRVQIAGADKPCRTGHLVGNLRKAALGGGVAVDGHQRARRTQALGNEACMPAGAKGAVDGDLTGLRVQRGDELVRKHWHVLHTHALASAASDAPAPRACALGKRSPCPRTGT